MVFSRDWLYISWFSDTNTELHYFKGGAYEPSNKQPELADDNVVEKFLSEQNQELEDSEEEGSRILKINFFKFFI